MPHVTTVVTCHPFQAAQMPCNNPQNTNIYTFYSLKTAIKLHATFGGNMSARHRSHSCVIVKEPWQVCSWNRYHFNLVRRRSFYSSSIWNELLSCKWYWNITLSLYRILTLDGETDPLIYWIHVAKCNLVKVIDRKILTYLMFKNTKNVIVEISKSF